MSSGGKKLYCTLWRQLFDAWSGSFGKVFTVAL